MSEELIFNRIIAIVENGSYGGATLSMKGLRDFPASLDTVAKPPCCLPMERADSGWQNDSGASFYTVTLSYDLHFYIREAGLSPEDNAKGLAQARVLRRLARQIFLSRPQLQLSSQTDIAEIAGKISWQNTSNLANPIPYPPASVAVNQGGKIYWGFIARISIPYREFIEFKPKG